MGFGDDEDILQDFLVEAGEILERLSQQLVDLEQRPDDTNLLNAIFRGFHTVKGGAGFLQLNPMVECCHLTENLFDILRTGKRTVTSELMDVVLQSLDAVNQQFELVAQRQELPPVDPGLIAALERLVSCDDLESASSSAANSPPVNNSADRNSQSDVTEGDFTDREFEQFLDAIAEDSPAKNSAPSAVAVPAQSTSSDEISDDEFEALLDQLHGKGKAPAPAAKEKLAPAATSTASAAKASPAASDDISEDEFEALLDQLHGKGKAPSKESAAKTPADVSGVNQALSNKNPGSKKSPASANATSANTAVSKASSSSTPSTNTPAAGQGDLISDDEFENLLDQLHGKGKAPSKPTAKAEPVPISTPAKNPKQETPKNPAAAVSNIEKDAASNAPPAAETTVRVDTQRLDDIMNMVGELVLVRNRLVRLGADSQNEALVKAVANLDLVTADLQTSVMKTRMQPIKKVFGRFPRVVRDLARSLKKEINLDLVGEETDLDKNLVEALADPLVHLVRNSVDHGIELPEVRVAAGKPRVGQIVLSAEQEGDHILLSITDDGAGIDPVKLRKIAVEKGMFDQDTADRLSDIEAFNLIFAPGFSTKKEISDVSGRGVGMDVVKTKISQLNGSVEIQSTLGKGTRLVIKVPLTLAIMPTLMIMLGNQTFALPLASVNEIFHMDLRKSHVVDGQECIAIRDQAIPLFHLKQWLVKNADRGRVQSEAHVVIVSVGTRRVAFVVDQLIGQEEVVIKPLGKMLQGTPGMAGATITGDGAVALILDVPSMLRRYARGASSWGHS